MIKAGLYTGQRLKDIALLTRSQVDLKNHSISLVTGKTGRQQVIPIAKPLLSYLKKLPSTKDAKEPIFPECYKLVKKFGRSGVLSSEFHKIMVKAGLATERSHAETGKGKSRTRKVSELSFHSLRHTATSMMKNAGVGSAVVQDLVGHESAAVSTQYTHIDDAAKRKALNSLPRL
jgi:integrase